LDGDKGSRRQEGSAKSDAKPQITGSLERTKARKLHALLERNERTIDALQTSTEYGILQQKKIVFNGKEGTHTVLK
jgi:hypothetical protein